MTDTSSAFVEAEALLRKYGFAAQADVVRKGLAAVQADGAAGYRQLATAEWWGESGSIADVYLYREGESFTVGQEQDNRKLRAALTAIYAAMRKAGVAAERPASWTAVFEPWQNDGA